ncbi:hypothetical protein CQ018_17715 [Arthrobacter sp. MYb227]|nr:hypothetical protein CQ018_17715 [Arthrobacter sp. MYb227]
MAQLLADQHTPVPGYCGISQEARERSIEQFLRSKCGVEFELVRGHTGNLRNKAADSMVDVARSAARYHRAEIAADLLAKMTDLEDAP